MSLAQQSKIKRSSKTEKKHIVHLVVLYAEGRKCLLTFGPQYFVFQNHMSDDVRQCIRKNYFGSHFKEVRQLAVSC